jgi:teichuronic acid biosynthesis glycosyltransferase TuaC
VADQPARPVAATRPGRSSGAHGGASAHGGRLHVLSITTLYPNAEQPNFGVFVENRLRRLAAADGVALRVVAPVPWFPSSSGRFGRYAQLARVPWQEIRAGIEVTHPRYLAVPKVGMTLAPLWLYASLRRHLARTILPRYEIDLIDAHYFYPDGVAAALIARWLGKPLVITGRGTDLNLLPRWRQVRRMIRWAADRADACITVSAALRDVLLELGVEPGKLHVLRNGVDLSTFAPRERALAQRAWQVSAPTILSVGHLIERKGHDLVIEALPRLPGVRLLIVGEGPERERLEGLAQRLDVADRVRLAGVVPHERLAAVYSAADALVLASSREGWPNVVLEALACGTPVVATRVWGTPEIVTRPEAGLLLDERTPGAIAAGVRRLLVAPPDRAATRRFAERFSWDETTTAQIELFRSIVAGQFR